MVDADAYRQLIDELPDHVTLIAVSKTKPVSDIQDLYRLGHRDFGENKVQELISKMPECPADIRWHLIGPLQRNKVNKVVGEVDVIHSASGMKLIEKIDQRAEALAVRQRILVQVNISGEDSKSGYSIDELMRDTPAILRLKHIQWDGLMTIGAHVKDPTVIKKTFTELAEVLDRLNKTYNIGLTELSMGMTGDYPQAVDAGATMVRIGSKIFGTRN